MTMGQPPSYGVKNYETKSGLTQIYVFEFETTYAHKLCLWPRTTSWLLSLRLVGV